MNEIYPARDERAAECMAATRPADSELARVLLARLLPKARAELLVAALLEEQASPPSDDEFTVHPRDSDLQPPARELRRIRTQLSLGEVARTVQHAVNNPLTALLAEAQLLEEELEEGTCREAVSRIVEMARRMVAGMRQLDLAGAGQRIG